MLLGLLLGNRGSSNSSSDRGRIAPTSQALNTLKEYRVLHPKRQKQELNKFSKKTYSPGDIFADVAHIENQADKRVEVCHTEVSGVTLKSVIVKKPTTSEKWFDLPMVGLVR